jgi:hypothetical protein
MTTTQFVILRDRANALAKLVRLDLSTANTDLDSVYEHAAKLLDVVGELRIVDAMLERQATADALAVPCGRA